MVEQVGMRISFPALLGWTMPLGLMGGGLGVWPTWAAQGWQGLRAGLVALIIVFCATMLSGAAVAWQASRGPGRAAMAFIVSGPVKMIASLVAAAAAWWVMELAPRALFTWTGIFYLVLLAGESVWLARALQRDAFLWALGEIRHKPAGRDRPVDKAEPEQRPC